MRNFFVALMLAFSMRANAGVGISAAGIGMLAIGNPEGLVVAGAGVGFIAVGRWVMWEAPAFGVLVMLLAEKGLITAEDYDLITNADIATQEAFINIVTSKELSSEERAELLSELEF